MTDLVPPDLARCQADHRPGSFMTLGPRTWERCGSPPVVIATEVEPGPDGRVGSMALCGPCRDVLEGLRPGRCRFTPIQVKIPTFKRGKR